MKHVYVIISEQYMPNVNYSHPCGKPDFVFTSIKKARAQMFAIKKLIEQGEWYMQSYDKPVTHTIKSFHEYGLINNSGAVLMFMEVAHSNDTYSTYTLHECELNEGYGI